MNSYGKVLMLALLLGFIGAILLDIKLEATGTAFIVGAFVLFIMVPMVVKE